NPRTGDVLNEACFRHDQCYDHIEERTGVEFPRQCTFSALTTDCDRPFHDLCQTILNSPDDVYAPNDRIACRIGSAATAWHGSNCKDPCNIFGLWESDCPAFTKCPPALKPAETSRLQVSLELAANGGALPWG